VVLLCALAVPAVSVAAENSIEPGMWKVTSNTRMNGATAQPQVKLRCLSPDQASDVGTTFGPESATVNSSCERTDYQATGRTLKWRVQCKGQLDMDISGDFNFDSPLHYHGTVASKGWMAGALISDVKVELEGEHVSECQ
jgi:hypothetical protein